MLALASQHGPISNPELANRVGLRLDGAERVRLNDMKLVESQLSGRAYVHELTEEGWRACTQMATSAVPGARAVAAEKAFCSVLWALAGYLDRTGQELREVISGPQQPDPVEPDHEARIVAAYGELASASGDFVKLTDLRAGLAGIPRTDLDIALAQLYRTQRVNLVPESNQRRLSSSDRQAALRIGGEDKHLIAIGAA